jgi:hypothetical protein
MHPLPAGALAREAVLGIDLGMLQAVVRQPVRVLLQSRGRGSCAGASSAGLRHEGRPPCHKTCRGHGGHGTPLSPILIVRALPAALPSPSRFIPGTAHRVPERLQLQAGCARNNSAACAHARSGPIRPPGPPPHAGSWQRCCSQRSCGLVSAAVEGHVRNCCAAIAARCCCARRRVRRWRSNAAERSTPGVLAGASCWPLLGRVTKTPRALLTCPRRADQFRARGGCSGKRACLEAGRVWE